MKVAIALIFAALAACANAAAQYKALCDSVFCRILEDSAKEINELRRTVDNGSCVPSFGSVADVICNSALERFSQEAPLPDDDKSSEALYDKKIEDLEQALDAPLHVLYMKQLSLIREKALKSFKSALGAEGSEYEAMVAADELFRREADEITRQTPDWDYAKETKNLKSALTEVASRSRKIQEVKLTASKQQQNLFQFMQMQQQQMQALQQQMQGSSSPWNMALAYRVPDSNVNLNLNYQQGRANVQVSCVPDEAVPLLGPNGFVQGVTPGNLGLSFNVNV